MKFLDSIINFLKKIEYDDFKKLYKYYTSKIFTNPFTPPDTILYHYFMFLKGLKRNYKQNILAVGLAPRNAYKTTTFSKVFPLMVIGNSIVNNDDLVMITIGSYTLDRVTTAIFDQIRQSLNQFQELTILKSTNKKVIFKFKEKEFCIEAFHLNESLRSLNHLGRRPQLVILDDIDVPATINELKSREFSVSRFKEDWLPAIEDGNAFILAVGNLEHDVSILNFLIKNELTHKMILPYKINNQRLKPEWDDKWEEEERNILGKTGFERLYEHKLPSEKYQFLFTYNPSGTRIIVLDIGTSNNSNSMAFVCFIGNTIVDIWSGTINQFIDEGIEKINQFKPHILRYEGNGMQRYLFEQIAKLIPNINCDVFYTTTEKEFRMSLASLKLRTGEIQIHPDVEEELKIQLGIFEAGDNSHILDIIGTYVLEYMEGEPYVSA